MAPVIKRIQMDILNSSHAAECFFTRLVKSLQKTFGSERDWTNELNL